MRLFSHRYSVGAASPDALRQLLYPRFLPLGRGRARPARLLSLPHQQKFPSIFLFFSCFCNNSRAKIVLQVEGTRPRLTAYLHKGVIEDVYAVCSFCFCLAVRQSVGLAFHVTWGLAKFVATLLFVIALPLLVVFAVVGALLPLLLPLALVLPPSAF